MTISQSRPAFLTGIGAITPFANGWNATFQAASAGPIRYAPWPADLEPPTANAALGLVKDYPKEKYFTDRQLRVMDKAMTLASVATGLAFEDAKIDEAYRTEAGDEIGTIFTSMRGEVPSIYRYCSPLIVSNGKSLPNPAHFPMIARNVACGQVALRFGLRGWSTMIASGELSTMHALGRAVSLVESGKAPMIVVAAYETLSKISLHHARVFWRKHGIYDQLFQDPQSNADALIEGACVFVIESEDSALRRGVTPYARFGRVTQGQLQRPTAPAFRDIARRHAAKNETDRIAASFLVSSRQNSPAENEQAMLAALTENASPLSEIRTRPIFGDGGSQTPMFQVACAAQMLKDGKLVAGLLAPGTPPADGVPPSGATVTQVGLLGGYGLLSLGRA